MREEYTAHPASPDIERIFEDCHGLVFRTAYRITGNAADAEDVMQAIFLRLLRRDAASLPVGNPDSYLRRAAVNGALDVIRSRHDSRNVPLDDSPPPAVADDSDTRDALRSALSRLNPRSAEIFALRFFEGYKNPEIAKMLGISQMQVAVAVHRTRKQLQKELKPYLGGRS